MLHLINNNYNKTQHIYMRYHLNSHTAVGENNIPENTKLIKKE